VTERTSDEVTSQGPGKLEPLTVKKSGYWLATFPFSLKPYGYPEKKRKEIFPSMWRIQEELTQIQGCRHRSAQVEWGKLPT
jgi:hypothetical protein